MTPLNQFARYVPFLVLAPLVVVFSWPRLTSDAIWPDEVHVLIGAHGRSRLEPLPQVFSSETLAPPTLGNVIAQLCREDVYPPLIYLIINGVARLTDPILGTRWLFVLSTLLSSFALFQWLQIDRPAWKAAVVTMLSAIAPALVAGAAELKWTALTPAVGILCGLALLRAVSRTTPLWWLLYGTTLLTLFASHYFCLTALPAHGFFVLTRHRGALKRWLITASATALPAVLWIAWAVPQQKGFVDMMLSAAPSVGVPTWSDFMGDRIGLAWVGYLASSVVGLEHTGLRTIWIGPVVALVGLGVWLGLRTQAKGSRHKDMAVLALAQLIAAVGLQTIYAWHLGNVQPLFTGYFLTWFPLALVSIGIGLESYSVWALALFTCWNVAYATGQTVRPADYYKYQLSNLPAVAAEIESRNPDLVVHRSDKLANVVNIYYRGRARQTVCGSGCGEGLWAGARRVLIISPADLEPLPIGPGFSVVREIRIGRTTMLELKAS